MSEESFVWEQKYRPRTVDDCVLPQHTKALAKQIVEQGQIPNMLYSGLPGTGKTSCSFAIANEIGADVLFINASAENSIDVIRTRVRQFASTVSLEDSPKLVIMDECLEENEQIRLGTVDNWTSVALNALDSGYYYPIVSFNPETETFENDTGYVASDKVAEVFKVTMDDMRTIQVTSNHPFMARTKDGEIKEISIDEGLDDSVRVVIVSGKGIVDTIEYVGKRRVINLTVEKNHTFVTANGIVTHNCDGLTPASQGALRGFIEQFEKNCHFIFTCNYKNKLIDALHSRLKFISFDIPKDERSKIAGDIYARCQQILETEGIKYDKRVLQQLVKRYFPDFRRLISELQTYSVGGEIDTGILAQSAEGKVEEVFGLMRKKEWSKMRQWVAENSDVDFATLTRAIYDQAHNYIESRSLPDLVLIIADAQYKRAFVADPEVHAVAFFTEVMSSVDFK